MFKNPHFDIQSEKFSKYDVGIVKLLEPVQLSTTVQVACLSTTNCTHYPALESPVIILGWGKTKNGMDVPVAPNTLRKGVTHVVSCNDNSDTLYFCTFGAPISCHGDSGGPVFQIDTIGSKSKYVLTGIQTAGVVKSG